MGKTLSASEETQLLKDTIREAHETIKDLRAAIREARELAPTLVADFEALHQREMALLSNHLQSENNRAATQLNAEVEAAKQEIINQLTHTVPVIDPNTGMLILSFPGDKFDDQVPPPYPEVAPKGTPQ